MSAPPLPDNLTSYDFLKSFALITMVADHVGVYLFPDDVGWRIVGRMSLPVWLFLIGYARTREIGVPLIGSAILLLISNVVFGEHVLPLNILFTIALARLAIDNIMQRAAEGRASMVVEFALLTVGMVPTLMLFDYGTHALLFAMLGYLVRHRERIGFSARQVAYFAGAASLVHGATQAYLFAAGPVTALTMVAAVSLSVALTLLFRPAELPTLTRRLPFLAAGVLKLMGRHALVLYVVHLLVLKALAAWLVWDRVDWFRWRWFLFD
ncbi:MAG: TraX family protein [Gammaproteobacteria bacterium]|nr:TraX family protein [Gammaproteobacteria bacterium]